MPAERRRGQPHPFAKRAGEIAHVGIPDLTGHVRHGLIRLLEQLAGLVKPQLNPVIPQCRLHHVDQTDPSKDWTIKLESTSRDIQIVGKNQLLVTLRSGYAIYDLSTRKLRKKTDGYKGVESARRLSDGRTILFQHTGGKTILQELGPDDKPLRKAVFPAFKVGGMMRPTGEGTFLLGAKLNEFAEVDLDGTIHRRVTIPKPKPCYHTLPVSDGNILTSCGYGAFIAEIDPKGKIVNRIGGMQDAPEGVNPFFFGGMQLLENGHIVVANWNGHANHSWRNGAQLIEYDEAGRIVWTYHDAKRIPGTLHGVLILE